MSQSLLAFDTDRIQGYVFATDMLKEIRGASRLLDCLNRYTMPREVGGKRYYAHGGGGLFRIATSDAADAIKRVQRAYAEHTGGAATITGVAVELPSDFDETTDNIQKQWKQLGYRLRAAKDRNQTYQTSVSHPLLHHGHTDGNVYATDQDEEDKFISRVSKLKRQENSRQEEPRPEDFDAIARVSTPNNYFALMVADGDGLGQALGQCETLPQIQALASTIYDTLKNVVKQAATDHDMQPDQYDILLLGGDDLVVALPAHKALPFAMQVADQFTAQMQQSLQNNATIPDDLRNERFTLSTAVVWAHTKFPFGVWHDIAESALKFTKQQRAHRLQTNPVNTDPLINFLVISSANHLEFDSYYSKILTWKSKDKYEQIIRTLRPYTVADLQQLIDYRKGTLRGVSRSKLESLRQAVFQPTHQQAMLDALRVLVHWRSDTQKTAIQQLIRESVRAEGTLFFPFICTKSPDAFDDDEMLTTYCTPLADLAELWDFIPGGGDYAA